ncbi:autophagy-related protein 13a [Magnolia sinica]|uniref:autophagy-related protein 13a n=1 Tax=Magnolia sinica TaxID=86752 RepID=UPI002658470E|nr:autophagy-related protein 13a [Magnolia sinica]
MALNSESGRSEQIISQFFLKSLHIILDSRIPSLHCRPHDHNSDLLSVSRAKKSDRWFNLALGDRPAVLENLNFWHRSLLDPMIIDVILIHQGPPDTAAAAGDPYNSPRAMVETVIERWVVQYESSRTSSQVGEGPTSYKKTYKKSIILLRSLYSILRLLPAFRVFRQLTTSTQSYSFNLSYKVSSFSELFSREEEGEMKSHKFAPVDTQSGRLCVDVMYRPALSDFNLEALMAFPPQIITDYVGSPAADPLRTFPSSSDSAIRSTTFPLRGFRSPSSTPLQRPHSWTSGIHRASPTTTHPFSVSPPTTYPIAPIYSDYRNSPPDIYGQKTANYRPSSAHRKGTSFDECRLSPPFSPSLSPSPPTYFSSTNPLHARLRSESSPVSIPLPATGRSPRYLNPNSSDPNRHFLPPPSPRSVRADHSSQDSPSESRSFRREFYSGIVGQKVFKDARDDSGRFSGVVSSSGSPRIGFSRSSSRLSFQDDLDDCDFSCPFAVDDVDSSDSQARISYGKEAPETTTTFPSARQSQDAAVGILVHMLRTAPPLRQDSYSSQLSKSEFDGEVSASASFMSRKASDALEELRSYREMKDLLLSQSGTQLQDHH